MNPNSPFIYLILSPFLLLAVYAGIAAMHWNWNATKDMWSIPIKERQDWIDQRKSDRMMKFITFKMMIKGGGLVFIVWFLSEIFK